MRSLAVICKDAFVWTVLRMETRSKSDMTKTTQACSNLLHRTGNLKFASLARAGSFLLPPMPTLERGPNGWVEDDMEIEHGKGLYIFSPELTHKSHALPHEQNLTPYASTPMKS